MAARVVRLHRTIASRRVTLADEVLVAACGAGDQAALGTLYDRHSAAVLRFVKHLVKPSLNDVDDMVHDTFIAAYKASGRFRGGSAVRTWLLGIASNVVRHAVRARCRRQSLARAVECVVPPAVTTPDETLSASELRDAMADAIDALPHNLRTVFVLCDIEDLACDDVAAALRVPKGTLFRRRHEARRALREALGSSR